VSLKTILLPLALLLPPDEGLSPPPCHLLKNVRVLVGTGEEFESADVLIRDGVIEKVEADLAAPWDARVIDRPGLVVTPGLIDAGSTLLTPKPRRDEDSAEDRSPDVDEGELWRMDPDLRKGLSPAFRVADVLHPPGDAASKHHRAGFTTILAVPHPDGLSGRSALVELGRGVPAELLLLDDVAMHLTLRPPRGGGYPSTLMGGLAHLRQFFADALHARESWEVYRQNGRQTRRPRLDAGYQAALRMLDGEQIAVFEADAARDILTCLALAREFELRPYISGGAEADRVVEELRAAGAAVLLALDFPDEVKGLTVREVSEQGAPAAPAAQEADPPEEVEPKVPERVLQDQDRERRARIATASVLAQAGVPFALTTTGLKDASEFSGNLRLALDAGLSREAALAALTDQAARLLGVGGVVGAVRPGMVADLAVFDGDPFDEQARVEFLFVRGERLTIEHPETKDGKNEKNKKNKKNKKKKKKKKKGQSEAEQPEATAGPAEAEAPPVAELPSEIDQDRRGRLETGGNVVLRNGTVHTVSGETLERAWVVVRDGKIAGIGREADGPPDLSGSAGPAQTIDCEGMHVTPGIIDCHSHIAISGGVNESASSITAEVRIDDEIDGDSLSIFRALAGGVTTAQLLHGSANAIGGQSAVIKLKYRRPAGELRFPDAPRGIKFALGENPKRASSRDSTRYPRTRMGVEAVIRRAFREAQAYAARLRDFDESLAAGEQLAPPRRDLRLEALAGVLDGSIRVHSHCYRADEILMLIRLAEEFGFQIATFQHVLEGYKVGPEIARHGAGASTFSDWWAYKAEAFDAIPYNAALMERAGVVVSLNSDSAELMRRLNLEAAKAVKYGGLDDNAALSLVTLNPARQLGIDRWVGSIETGKHADLAIWSGDPLSVYSTCEWTLVDGEVEFQRAGHPTASSALIDRGAPIASDASDASDATDASGASDALAEDEEPAAAEAAATFDPSPVDVSADVAGAGRYALTNARLVPVATPAIVRGTLLVADGRIEALGADLEVPDGYERIDCSGLTVYPGMLDPGTRLGLTEIGSVSGTVDTSEQGLLQADLRAAVAINPASEHFPVARANGITSAVVRPRGALIAGQSALVRLDGWTWEQMVLVDPLALHVSTPGSSGRSRFRRSESSGDREQERLEQLKQAFEEARELSRLRAEAARAGQSAPPSDARTEALLPYLAGERPVIFDADDEQAIEKAVELARELGLRPILSGAREAWKVAGLLARHDVPVLLGPVLATPSKPHDPYDAPFACASVLARAGVRFAFQTNDSSSVRNLPYQAAMAAAYGLDRERALEAITLAPAQILGVDRDLGSLEPGKLADLVIADGDLLEIRTRVVRLFISGRPISLETRHTRLYEQFSERVERPERPGRLDGELGH